MSDLTPKQRRFCEEYVVDLNGTQAAIRSGYSEDTATEQASRLLSNVKVQAYVKELQEKVSEKLGIDHQWVVRRLKEISDRCMQAEPVMERRDGELVETGEYQFDSSGANKATELLGKIIGVFEKHNDQKGNKIVVKLK